MASAKFANNTVNHSHNVICRLKAKLCFPRNSSRVVTTLPTSTTNMTGFFIMVRGSSLYHGIHQRSPDDFCVPQTLVLFLCHAFLQTLCVKKSASEGFSCHHHQVLKYGP